MGATQAIVTLAVGPAHGSRWRRWCEPGWRVYADRHDYDIVCIEEPLDTSDRARLRSPAWQKCLVLGHEVVARYERVAWVDADVVINPAAPSIMEGVPPDKVGAVDEFATPSPELHRRNLQKLYSFWEGAGIPFIRNETGEAYYEAFGLPPAFSQVVQTGVMVLSPEHHRPLLEDVYHRYEDRGATWNYEMRPLSYELLRAGAVHWLDPRFNYVWGSYKSLHFPFLLNHPDHPRSAACAAEALRSVHFLHFAGAAHEVVGLAAAAEAAESAGPVVRRLRSSTGSPRLEAPVVLLAFARPDTTALVLDAIRQARPQRLLVVADGPRPGVATDGEACAATRRLIDTVDWDCEVLTEYAAGNLGLKRRVESGLDWAFGIVDEAIVLEDDCVPHPTFFRFAGELLDRYRDDHRVLSISGNNFEPADPAAADRYSFSRYPLIWGWATWRRAWALHDSELHRWPELRETGWLSELLEDETAVKYWSYLLERTRARRDTWDYAWTFSCWLAGGLHAVPGVNLVSNVGFRADGTHTRDDYDSVFANLPARALRFPLRHPAAVARDVEADRFIEDVVFSGNLARLFARLRARRPDTRSPVAP